MNRYTLNAYKSLMPKTIKKTILIALSSVLLMSTTQADIDKKNVGDLEIYQAATGGNINLTMMLDTSGSMGISSLVLPSDNAYGSPGDVNAALCMPTKSSSGLYEWAYNAIDIRANTIKTTNIYDAAAKTHTITTTSIANPLSKKNTFYKLVNINGTDVPYYLRGCGNPSIDTTGKLVESVTGKFDRLSRLKDALIQLLVSDKIDDKVSIGLGNFSSKTPILIGNSSNKLVDGHSGTILVPAAPLDSAQRLKLIRAIADFRSVDTFTDEDGTANTALASNSTTYPDIYKSSSGTPTAHAYAEAAAYMMGTNTGIRTTALPTQLNYLYDGSIVMQKTSTTSINDQVYYICVGLGQRQDADQFGAKIKQCDNAWNADEINPNTNRAYGTWYDSTNKMMGSNIAIYKPNGTGGWTIVTPTELRDKLLTDKKGTMDVAWDTHAKLPVGWRYGGWMKVANSPLDIEAINTKGYGNSGGATAYVSYRASPFSIETTTNTTTNTTQGFQNCPSGYQVDPSWVSLCYQEGNWSKAATNTGTSSRPSYSCPTPVQGADPIPNVYDRSGNGKLQSGEEHANKNFTSLNSNQCKQTRLYVARPWGNSTNSVSTVIPVDNLTGGFAYSASDTKTSRNYIRAATPIGSSTAQCDSNGIYFLTDGAPNSTKDDMAKTIMNASLASATSATAYTISSKPTTGLLSPALTSGLFTGETAGWEWIGEYAKRLNNKDTNPAGVSIRTAVAGFGSSFAGLTKRSDGTYDCDTAGATQDAKNACQWGQKGQGYGEGGFFYAQSADDISNSLITFIASLNNTIPAAPSGTITIPRDPYRAIGELPYAYMPSLEAQLSGDNNTRNIWPGNVKKYKLNDGTLYGQSNTLLFSNVNGDLDTATRDLWQTTTNYTVTNPTTGAIEVKNSTVQAGGMYQNLQAPQGGTENKSDTRTIYVEDLTAANATTTTLRELYVKKDGTPSGFDNLKDIADTTTSKAAYSRANQIKLLQFMGYESATGGNPAVTKSLDNWSTDTSAEIKDLKMVAPTAAVKVLGASIHSKPVAVAFSAPLLDGRVQDTGRDDYALFGSMDGVLHLADADNYTTADSNANKGGTEKLAIIPRVMMLNQSDALIPNSKYTASTNRAAAVPFFGIDGNWLVTSKYNYDYPNNKVMASEVYAYGGMRLGGKGLLGYNLSSTTAPSIAFTANGTSNTSGTSLIDNTTTGFERMGYIWSQPTLVKVKTSIADTGTDALVFGGGYDKCYENQYFQADSVDVANITDASCKITTGAKTKPQAEGNAVYIINAKTGALLWSATYDSTGGNGIGTNDSSKFDGKKYMKHSIVGAMTVLDRDNDGFMDQMYFNDLGGQLFRADFKGGLVGSSTTANTNGRIVRLLKDNNEGTAMARRFYERPNISIYHQGSKKFVLINVISGDRSSPLSKIRGGTTAADIQNNADRLYGIIDTDVTMSDNVFYAQNLPTTFPAIKDLVVTADDSKASTSGLIKLGAAITTTNTVADLIAPLKSYTKKGWYYPLTKFDGFENVQNSKGIGRSEVINSQLYSMVYNPDMNYSSADNCTAKIKGGSEREMYCLPWGLCNNETSTNGTGGYERAGQGLQEINFGPQSDTQLNRRLLIGTIPMSTIINQANRTNWGNDDKKSVSNNDGGIGLQNQGTGGGGAGGGGTGGLLTKTNGSGSLERVLLLERYILTPKLWYEQN